MGHIFPNAHVTFILCQQAIASQSQSAFLHSMIEMFIAIFFCKCRKDDFANINCIVASNSLLSLPF